MLNKIKQIFGKVLSRGLIDSLSFAFPGAFLSSYIKGAKSDDVLDFNGQSVATLSFDCDLPPDIEAIPTLLELVSRYRFKTSFACIGKWIEKDPSLHRQIINQGHEIVNHTYSHPNNEVFNPNKQFNKISKQEREEEIIRCHEVISKLLNYAPVGFRVPHFGNLFIDDIYPVISKLGYKYSSSTLALKTKSRGRPYKAFEEIVEFPVSPCPRHPFAALDSYHFFRSGHPIYKYSHRDKGSFIKCFQELMALVRKHCLHLNVYFDPMDIVENKQFLLILDLLAESGIEVLNYAQIIQKYCV